MASKTAQKVLWIYAEVADCKRCSHRFKKTVYCICTYIIANNMDDICTYKSADIIQRYPHLCK